VIAAVSLVDRIETSVLTGVLPLLQQEWGFSDTAGGAIPTAVTIAGVLVALPAGYLADRVTRKNLLAVVVASWSVITLASGLAISFAMFFGTRVVLGAADSLDIPSQSSLLGDYYPPEQRPKVFGLQRMVFFAGTGVGALLGGVIGQFLGWRMAFFSMILPGLLVAWWCYRLREPERGNMDRLAARRAGMTSPDAHGVSGADDPDQEPMTGESAALEDTDTPVQGAGTRLQDTGTPLAASAHRDLVEGGLSGFFRQVREIFRVHTLYYLFGGMVVLFLSLSGIFFWLPTFFVRHWEVGEGLGGTLTALVTIIGVPIGTVVGAIIGRRWHGSVKGGRVVASAIGFVLGSILMGAGFLSPSLPLQVGLIVAATAAMSIAIPNLFAAAADCIHATNRGVGFTFTQLGTAAGSSFGPLTLGIVSDRTGSLLVSFYVLIIPIFLAGLVTLRGRATYDEDARRVLSDSLHSGGGSAA
jgi:MFS family permease